MEKEPYLRGMWEHFSCERLKPKKFRQLADKEKQSGIQGQWQQESPVREYFEQVKCCHDTDCNEPMMKKGFTASKNGTWEECKETYLQEKDESLRMGHRQDKRCVRVGGTGRDRKDEHCCSEARTTCGVSSHREESQCLTCARTATISLWKTTFGGSLGGKTTKWWCATCGEKYDWRQPNRLLVVHTGDSFELAKVYKAHAVPQGLCANLINALELLANEQDYGDGLLQNIVTNLGKGSRKGLTDGLRDFIRVEYEAPWMLERCAEALEGSSEGKVRESPDELTLRTEEVNTSKALINVDHIEPGQALYKGIEGEDWEAMYDSF